MKWTWEKDRVSVTDGKGETTEHRVLAAKFEDVALLSLGMDRSKEVFARLKRALDSFDRGTADYADAATKIDSILSSLDATSARIVETARSIDAFLDPPAASARFGDEVKDLINFACEGFSKLGTPNGR